MNLERIRAHHAASLANTGFPADSCSCCHCSPANGLDPATEALLAQEEAIEARQVEAETTLFRDLASLWHDGQGSALYAYASTGTILPSLAGEILACIRMAPEGAPSKAKADREIARLQAFAAAVTGEDRRAKEARHNAELAVPSSNYLLG